MKKPIIYSHRFSPPVRATWLTCKAIGLDIDIQFIDFFSGEHVSSDYKQKNPQHTVPTLDDNGNILWDSHAICTYLIGKYAKDDELYPKDLYVRGKIDQRLHFDTGILFSRLRTCLEPVFFGADTLKADAVADLYKAYTLLEKFLTNDPYLVGQTLTIADICSIATVTTMAFLAPINPNKYPKLSAWIQRISMELPNFYEINTANVEIYSKFVENFLKNNKEPQSHL